MVVSTIREKKSRVKEIGVEGCFLEPRDSLAEVTFDTKNNIWCISKHLISVSVVIIITIN